METDSKTSSINIFFANHTYCISHHIYHPHNMFHFKFIQNVLFQDALFATSDTPRINLYIPASRIVLLNSKSSFRYSFASFIAVDDLPNLRSTCGPHLMPRFGSTPPVVAHAYFKVPSFGHHRLAPSCCSLWATSLNFVFRSPSPRPPPTVLYGFPHRRPPASCGSMWISSLDSFFWPPPPSCVSLWGFPSHALNT